MWSPGDGYRVGGAAGGLIQSWGEGRGWIWRTGGIGEDLQLADLLPWSEWLFTAFLSDEEGCALWPGKSRRWLTGWVIDI